MLFLAMQMGCDIISNNDDPGGEKLAEDKSETNGVDDDDSKNEDTDVDSKNDNSEVQASDDENSDQSEPPLAGEAGVDEAETEGPGEASIQYNDPSRSSGTRLKVRYLQSETNVFHAIGFYDSELELNCSFSEAADGEQRCMPTHTEFEELQYSDENCETLIYAPKHGCDIGYIRDYESKRIYRKTDSPAVISGKIFYRSNACIRDGGFTTADIADGEFWLTELVPSSNFVRATVRDEARANGLVARYLDGEDGSSELVSTLHATRGYVCDFDSTGYCVPNLSNTGNTYSDANCTTPVHSISTNLPLPPLLMTVESSECKKNAHIL